MSDYTKARNQTESGVTSTALSPRAALLLLMLVMVVTIVLSVVLISWQDSSQRIGGASATWDLARRAAIDEFSFGGGLKEIRQRIARTWREQLTRESQGEAKISQRGDHGRWVVGRIELVRTSVGSWFLECRSVGDEGPRHFLSEDSGLIELPSAVIESSAVETIEVIYGGSSERNTSG